MMRYLMLVLALIVALQVATPTLVTEVDSWGGDPPTAG